MRGKRVRVLSVLVAAMGICTVAHCQKAVPDAPNSLHEVAMALLSNASVRIELKVDREQEAKAQLQLVTRLVRRMHAAFLSGGEAFQGAGSGGADWTEITRSDYTFSIRLSDLREPQLKRLYELTYQRRLLASLVTPQAKVDLQITARQRTQLTMLWHSREGLVTTESMQVRRQAAEQMRKFVSGFFERSSPQSMEFPGSDWRDDPLGVLLTGAHPILVKMMVDLSAIEDRCNFDSRAYELLSSSQKATLKKLRGEPFAWKPNI